MGIIRPMEESDLDNVLRWRNHPSIRRSMLTQHEISSFEHTDWFKSIQSDVNKYPVPRLIEKFLDKFNYKHF